MSPSSNRLRRFLHPLYRRLETVGHPLRYLFLEVTQRCNLACRHCGSDCSRDPKAHELTTAEWLAFLRYLTEHFDRRQLVLVVTGGEPFCHPDFDALLEGLHRSGFPWGMVTNGYALTAPNVAKVVANGLWSATVSLDGLRESHDWLRGKAGSFERAVAGVERLVRSHLPNFDVVTCVHPGNLDELPRLHDRLRALGVPAWRLFSIFPKGRAKANSDLLLSASGLRALLTFIADVRRQALPGPTVQFCCEGYLPPSIDRAVRDEPYFCRAGISIGSVLADGAIAACPNITRDLVQGNIRSDDFETVWETRFDTYRRREWMRQGPCVSCDEWQRCQGNSLHLWDAELGRTALCTHQVVKPMPPRP